MREVCGLAVLAVGVECIVERLLIFFTMKDKFIKILTDANLLHWFVGEFGEDWAAKEWHEDGWWFEEDSISYRSCDLFDNHSDGYNWDFWYGDFWLTILHYILLSHGFEQTHNGGDEEDGWYRMALKKQETEDIKQPESSDIVLPF